MTQLERADLIDLLGSATDDEAARQAVDRAAAQAGLPAHRLDPADALTLLAHCASRCDGVGVAAGLAHQRLALRIARQRGIAARAPTKSVARPGDRRDEA